MRTQVYELQVELIITKRAKEAIEDRMAELYGELQELAADASDTKYEKLLRSMNQQMNLLRTSSDALIQNLKDEMSDLMEETVQTELSLMNQLAQLEREKIQLEERVGTSIEVALNENELERFKRENAELKSTIESMPTVEEVEQLRQRCAGLQDENEMLTSQLEQQEVHKERFVPSEETLQRVEAAQQRANDSIDRIAVQWNDIDQTVREVGILTERLHSNNNDTQVLSVLEQVGLVHAQAKASLMWTELSLKNQMAHYLEGSQDSPMEPEAIQELLASVEQVEINVTKEIAILKERSAIESKELGEKYEGKVRELHQMKERQTEIETELSLLKRQQESNESSAATPGTEKVELFVSQKALESLQSEVMQIVEQLQAKNATISDMKSEIEEHRIRERNLMDELVMYRKDQAGVQQREQERLMQSFGKFDDSENCEDVDDDKSDYEERTVDDTYYCEETVYEEMTVA